MFDLPRGHFQLQPGMSEMCLDVLPNHRLRLTFRGPEDRNPVILEGAYVVSATKMSDFHFTFTVKTIRTKTLSNCRKFWIDADLRETERLETKIKPGSVLNFTAHFQCAKDRSQVQLCLHDAGKDRNKVICRNLTDHDQRCHQTPAIDGALINPPPNLPKPKPE